MTATITGNGIDKVQDGSIQAADLASGVPSRSQLPAGTVLQVVQGTSTTQVSSSSTSFVSAGLTATITPTSSASKVLVVTSTPVTNTNQGQSQYTIYRNAVNLGGGSKAALAMSYSSTGYTFQPLAIQYLDSPASTSATTYTVYFSSVAGTCYVNSAECTSTITLMEIAA